jgi:mitochondrial fission protein ELM1
VEGAIKTRLRNEPRCKLLVIANENNIDGAVEGIAGLSEILIASQESISMISEAASSGAYTVVFKQTRALDKRHNLFLEHLHKNGFIDIADTDSLYSRVSDVFEKNLKLKRLNDSAMIKDALEEIL